MFNHGLGGWPCSPQQAKYLRDRLSNIHAPYTRSYRRGNDDEPREVKTARKFIERYENEQRKKENKPRPKGRAVRMLASNGTFNDGRNEEKRKARAEARNERAIQVAVHQQSEIGVRHAPKCRLSVLEMNMIANRRVRQTRGGL